MPTSAEIQGLYDAGIGRRGNWDPFPPARWVWAGDVRQQSTPLGMVSEAWLFDFRHGVGIWLPSSGQLVPLQCVPGRMIAWYFGSSIL